MAAVVEPIPNPDPCTTGARTRFMHMAAASFKTSATIPSAMFFFSDLTHYVRFRGFRSQPVFAMRATRMSWRFAVGALSHYVGDTIGHSEATKHFQSRSSFPQAARRGNGPVVNYAEGRTPACADRVSRFDIAMISHQRLAPVAFTCVAWGLDVPTRQLALAFLSDLRACGRRMAAGLG